MSYSFQYRIEKKEKFLCIYFEGRLMDSSRTEEIKRELENYIQQGLRCWIVDLSGLEFMNSMGLNLLIQMQTKIRIQNGKMFLLKPNTRISDLIHLTKLDQFFVICKTDKELQSQLDNE
jgi:anti-sigma B factor antagonist